MAVNDKKVFLYVGKSNEAGTTTYPTYTDAQIKAFNADEFVLTCGNYPDYMENSNQLTQYINELFSLAKQVIECTQKFVWLGIPRPPEPTKPITLAEYEKYATRYLNEFIWVIQKKLQALKTASGYDYYYTYVQGFYMNDEHVRRKTLTYPFDTGTGKPPEIDDENGFDTKVTNLLSHPQIKMYSMVSDALKTSAYGWKKLLWVPYAGRGANHDTTFIDIAYIANTTDIFDTVLLQPGVYKHSSASVDKNMEVIRNSMNLQEVRGRDDSSNNKRIVAKRSSTKIGCQMEIDEEHTYNISNRRDNYTKTVNAFSGSNVTNPANRHFSFYWGADTGAMADLTTKVNQFFNTL